MNPTQTLTIEVLDCNFSAFQFKLAALNKKAKRHGLPEATFEKTGTGFQKYVNQEGYEYDLPTIKIELTFSRVILPGGWNMLGAIQHAGGVNFIKNFSDHDFEHLRHAKNTCDHCNQNRNRNNTYILESEAGEIKRVGKACLRLFLGTDSADKYAHQASVYAEFQGFDDAGFRDATHAPFIASLVRFIPLAAQVILQDKEFVSKAKAREDQRSFSTSEAVLSKIHSKVADDFTTEDYNLGLEALAYFSTLPASDYVNNVRAVLELGAIIDNYTAALVTSLVGTYYNHKQREATRIAAENSNYVGSVGERLSFEVVTVKMVRCLGPNDYGQEKVLVKFITNTGNILTWFTTKFFEEGETGSLVGTVKGHSEFKGEKSTTVTRCKFESNTELPIFTPTRLA